MKNIQLRELAHSRSGEKGRDCNVSVISYRMEDYDLIRSQVTIDAVRSIYGLITKGGIIRYEVPLISSLNFVISDVLEGGRSRTLAFDESGKALSSLILRLMVQVPDDYIGRAERLNWEKAT